MLEYIKEDKTFSFSYWRYRLLHWTFGVNPKNKEEAIELGLNKILYSHFCPLFWLTNMMLLASPFILAWKILSAVFKWAWPILEKGLDLFLLILYYINKYMPRRKTKSEEKPEEEIKDNPEKLRKQDLKNIIRRLKDHHSYLEDGSFEHLWAYLKTPPSDISVLTQEEAQSAWEKYRVIIKNKLEKDRLRREAINKNMVFWVNFSRVFIKGFMNVAFIGCAILFLYLLYWALPTVLWLVFGTASLILSIDILSVLWVLGQGFLWGFVGVLGLYGIYRLAKPLVLSFASIVGDAIVSLFDYVGNTVGGFADFLRAFYTDNCPSITIVEDEEVI